MSNDFTKMTMTMTFTDTDGVAVIAQLWKIKIKSRVLSCWQFVNNVLIRILVWYKRFFHHNILLWYTKVKRDLLWKAGCEEAEEDNSHKKSLFFRHDPSKLLMIWIGLLLLKGIESQETNIIGHHSKGIRVFLHTAKISLGPFLGGLGGWEGPVFL